MKPTTVVAGTLVAALAVGGVAWGTRQGTRTISYTTAVASVGTITQSLTSSGVVDRPGQQSLTFDSAGLVTALSVRVGDAVHAGDKLATIDPAPLQVTLLQAQAQLAQARAVLEADQTAKDNGGTVTGLPTGAATTGRKTPTAAPPTSGGPVATPPYVLALQRSLTKLQATVKVQQDACAPVYAVAGQLEELQKKLPTSVPTGLPTAIPTTLPTTPSTPSPTPSASSPAPSTATPSSAAPTSASPSSTPTSPAPTTASPSPTPSRTIPTAVPSLTLEQAKKLAGQVTACTDAMVALAGAEQEAGSAIVTASAGMQQATAAAQQQLVAAQQQMMASVQAAAQAAAAEAIAGAQAQLAAQAQRALGSRVTDATIAADRSRVLQAEQAVARAERAVAAATLTSPADGTIGAVSLVAGENSGTRSITVVGPGAAQVEIQVPLALRDLLTAGQAATVGLVGADPILNGRVTSVSVLPTSTAGTPTYTATLLVDDPGLTLKTGAKASVTIPLRSVKNVLTVPLSAVTKTADTTATVKVVTDEYAEEAQTVNVTTGAYGEGRIEITSGLTGGDRVVLADRRLPVPGGLQQYQPATPTPTPTPTTP